jgi:predicted actin-binding protein
VPSRPFRPAFLAAFVVLAFAASARAASPPQIEQWFLSSSQLSQIAVKQVGSQMQLQFPSQIHIGPAGGSLDLEGSRQDTTVATMTADQVVGGVSTPEGVFQFNTNPTHDHWHYLAIDKYSLVTDDSSLTEVGRDQKTGFCIGTGSLQGFCGQFEPDLLSISESIDPTKPNPDDIYDPAVDGQFIDITGIAAGTYDLVEWVNYDCRLQDTSPSDDTYAVKLSISYPNGASKPPAVSLLGNSHDTATSSSNYPQWAKKWATLTAAQQCLPRETLRPQLSGAAQVGSVLSAVPGSWLQRLAHSFDYQWRRCDAGGWNCSDIPGATAANYTPVAADVGNTLRARVTATDATTTEGLTAADSDQTAAVAGGPGGSPSGPTGPGGVSGPQPKGQVLGVTTLTASLASRHIVALRNITRHGLRVRVQCSQTCRATLYLRVSGGVTVAKRSVLLRHHHRSQIVVLRLSRSGMRALAHFPRGRVTLWLQVRSRDGARQTLAHVLRLRP